MGNDTSCSKLCQKGDTKDDTQDDILTTEYIIPCQICNQQFKHQVLKGHIDLRHYASIKEGNDGHVSVQCLLCGVSSSDLVEHGVHIKRLHGYAESGQGRSKIGSEVITEDNRQNKTNFNEELNGNKKSSTLKLTSERQFQIIHQIGPNHYQASIDGVKYEVKRFVKEYRGSQYQEHLAEGELLWFNIFKNNKKVKYYFFDLQPGHRNILCKAYLFMTAQE